MLGFPGRTPYDIEFRVLGFPVRIHPLFWVGSAVLGWSARDLGGNAGLFLWVACVLVSVLVHELGHALAARRFGQQPSIVLFVMGGFCTYNWNRQTTSQRVITLLSGPGAGFVLAFLVTLAARSLYGLTPANLLFLSGLPFGHEPVLTALTSASLPRFLVVLFLFQVNVFWGVLNLLPIVPLDGGMVALAALTARGRRGSHQAHLISLITAGSIAVYLVMHQSWFNALFFAYMAGYNMMVLQTLRHDRYAAGDIDAADWWKS